jgi:hypothetical protein
MPLSGTPKARERGQAEIDDRAVECRHEGAHGGKREDRPIIEAHRRYSEASARVVGAKQPMLMYPWWVVMYRVLPLVREAKLVTDHPGILVQAWYEKTRVSLDLRGFIEAWRTWVRVLWLFRGPLLLLLVCTIFVICWFATDLLPKLLPPTRHMYRRIHMLSAVKDLAQLSDEGEAR